MNAVETVLVLFSVAVSMGLVLPVVALVTGVYVAIQPVE